jgi:inward rectifier potassium channel
MTRPHHGPTPEELQDLGFGTRVTQQSRLRLLNRDGSFNVDRAGMNLFQSFDLYHALLNMSWPKFYATVFATFCLVNVLFAGIFLLCGSDALVTTTGIAVTDGFLRAFFFSVQTFTTVGYGHIVPNTLVANIVVIVNAFVGLLFVALATGLLFARFSRPSAKIEFSRNAVIAPYHGITAFEFRIANKRPSQLVEVGAQVLLILMQGDDGKRKRKFINLNLERVKVAFFPLSWTVVHPIDEESPLYNLTDDDLRRAHAEFLILLTAIDDTFSTSVHARSSYTHDEIIWRAKFADVFQPAEDGVLRVDLRRLHLVEKV